MIIALLPLALHALVLYLNTQTLLIYHAAFIAVLAFRLWKYGQPEHYTIREQGIEESKLAGENK